MKLIEELGLTPQEALLWLELISQAVITIVAGLAVTLFLFWIIGRRVIGPSKPITHGLQYKRLGMYLRRPNLVQPGWALDLYGDVSHVMHVEPTDAKGDQLQLTFRPQLEVSKTIKESPSWILRMFRQPERDGSEAHVSLGETLRQTAEKTFEGETIWERAASGGQTFVIANDIGTLESLELEDGLFGVYWCKPDGTKQAARVMTPSLRQLEAMVAGRLHLAS